MTIRELISDLKLECFTDFNIPETAIISAYAGDLLSDVMGNAPTGSIWITIQTHLNVVAVASLKEIPAIILANGRKPEAETIKKCNEEKVALLGSNENTFTLSGKLYKQLPLK
jgi:hypothetical protein